jgi:FKBP-type peptidyl-prolyl cis-trans isomerase FkpA
MTEITKVPLQPIAKGALTKLWIGVAAVALAAGGVAYATLPASVDVDVVKAGTGASPKADEVVVVNYTGKLRSGKTFDEGKAVPLPLEGMIPGFTEGLMQMKKGGKYKLTIPADKAYGAEEKRDPRTGEVVLPANSDLIFDIEVIDILSQAQFQQMMQLQQMMQQQGAGGAPGGPGGAAPSGAGSPPPPPPKGN